MIISIVRLLVKCTESFDSYRDLKLSLEPLYHTMIMSRLAALEIFEPRGGDLASAIKSAILDCCGTLEELFVRLQGYQEGPSVTGILRSRAPRRFDDQQVSWIKKRLETHLIALMEFLALNSYVRYPYTQIINLS